MQRLSLPAKNSFGTCIHLKTVKHLLRLFSGLKAGQLEISLSKKDNIYAWKSHYRQNIFLSTNWETEQRQLERESPIRL